MKIGSNKGFTLIELLIVIAIIGILAVALLPTVLGAPAKGRDAARKANLNSIVTAIEAAAVDGVAYPAGAVNGICVGATGATQFDKVMQYMQGGIAPMDPMGATNGPKLGGCTSAGKYLYNRGEGAGGKNYYLVAYVETPQASNGVYGDVKLSAVSTAPFFTTPTLSGAQTTCATTFVSGFPADGGCVFAIIK